MIDQRIIKIIYTGLLLTMATWYTLGAQVSPPNPDRPCSFEIYSEGFSSVVPTGWTGDFDITGPILEGWILTPTSTPTSDTGPDAPFEGSHYVYLETSGPAPDNAIFQITSPLITVPSNTSGLFFRLLMHGDETGMLTVNILDGATTTLLTVIGEQHSDGSTDNWEEVFVELSSFADTDVQFQFVGMKSIGDMGDIAIDDIRVCSIPDPIPTIGQWGLIILILIMFISSCVYIRAEKIILNSHITIK